MSQKLYKYNPTFVPGLALILTFLSLLPNTNTFKNFGMNKPHHLFHIGDRRPVSFNLGFGYWADKQPLRFKYANTDQQLYANMQIHDGESLFHERIDDKKSNINTQIKYQLTQKQYQAEITIENQQANQLVWFTYASVQNNDYRLVDHKKYTSYIYLNPLYGKQNTQQNQINLKCLSLLYSNQTVTINQHIYDIKNNKQNKDNQVNLFGVAANISETYTIHQIADTFRHLYKVYTGEEKITQQTRNDGSSEDKGKIQTKDDKIIQWEKKQIQLMKQNNWTNKNYVVMFIYGRIKKGQKAVIYVTNSTERKSFNNQKFIQKAEILKQKYTKNLKQQDKQKGNFLTHVISNLYGGITFYYGRLYTQNSLTVHKQDYSYTFTPSRLIFPRSFLWDDGFHQSVIVHYNQDIVIDMLTNWMNKVDIFGWIGRQQIRGSQISSMMPDSRFVFQDWFEMNPPTLMMSISTLIKKSEDNIILTQKLELFFINFYRKLQNWYRYFKNTQSHQSLNYQQTFNSTNDKFYRWHCKDECSKGNFMGSGLDDYPRRMKQDQISKQHVDLLSWLYFFSDSLVQIGQYMKKLVDMQNKFKKQLNINETHSFKLKNKYTSRINYYKKQAKQYLTQLYTQFYDEKDNLFKDVVVTKSDLWVQKFVDKIGYINLFPFLTGMLAEEKYQKSQISKFKQERVESIKKCLQIMTNEKLLLSKDGLRSLSFSDPLYGTDQNYWRGAVWLPINYMVLRACKLYYWNDSNAQVSKNIKQFYQQLRLRLINSVYNTYKDTGYLYENYYEGRGHRGFPFYGWTATIANIITQQY